jgi:hypothetical protein
MTEVPNHIEVMARGIYGPRPVSFDAASQGQRDCCIKEATAAHAALVEAGFVVMPVGLTSDQIKAANAAAERGMIAAAVKP